MESALLSGASKLASTLCLFIEIKIKISVAFYDGFWYDLSGARTRDLPHERRTGYHEANQTQFYLFNKSIHNYVTYLKFHSKTRYVIRYMKI